jgi:hypothetical protein
MVNFVVLSLVAAQAAGGAPPAGAEPPAGEAGRERKQVEQRVKQDLGTQADPFPSGALSVGTIGSLPLGGSTVVVPAIAVIVDGALGYSTLSAPQQEPTSEPWPQHKAWPVLQEVELALQATVDPYVKGDVFITFSPGSVEVEEAFLTTLSLPAGLQVKAGKIYSPFGRTSQLHRHQWTFVDQPTSMLRLVGIDGLGGAGADLAWLAPLPWFAELHVAYQATAPGLATDLQATGLARLVQYFDLSDDATLGLGLSWATFQVDLPGQWRNLAGADLYVKIRDPSSRAYVALQGELYGRQLDGESFGQARWGGYAQADWRIDRNWDVGVRWDSAPAPDAYAGGTQQTLTALAGWSLSEFFRLRAQPSLVLLPGGEAGFQAVASFEFIIGAHGAHPF